MHIQYTYDPVFPKTFTILLGATYFLVLTSYLHRDFAVDAKWIGL